MEHVGTFQDAFDSFLAVLEAAGGLFQAYREVKDEQLLDDIRAVVTRPPPVLPGLRACRIGAVEQHTVKASGS